MDGLSNESTARPLNDVDLRERSLKNDFKRSGKAPVAASSTSAMMRLSSEFPVFIDALDGPFELLPQRFGKEALDGNIKLLGKDDCEAWVDVVLRSRLAK